MQTVVAVRAESSRFTRSWMAVVGFTQSSDDLEENRRDQTVILRRVRTCIYKN